MTKKHVVVGLIGLAVILGWNVFLIQRDKNLFESYQQQGTHNLK